MTALACMALAACLAADPASDLVVARDLAPAYPEMTSLDPATRLSYAPAPGVSRVFRVAELRTFAARFGLSASPDHDICVERTVARPDPTQLLASMQSSLPDARIEILEYSRQPAPAGRIEFPRESLHQAALGNGALWNGSVRYAGNRRFTIWARVNVVATVHRVLALGDLKPDRAIEAGQVMLQIREEFPATGSFAQRPEEVAGRWPRMAIRAGAAIRLDQLSEPKEVTSGEPVRVDVFGGAAHLEFEGVAESSGAVGQLVLVRNPASNKRFRAHVEGKGRVSVGGNGPHQETR